MPRPGPTLGSEESSRIHRGPPSSATSCRGSVGRDASGNRSPVHARWPGRGAGQSPFSAPPRWRMALWDLKRAGASASPVHRPPLAARLRGTRVPLSVVAGPWPTPTRRSRRAGPRSPAGTGSSRSRRRRAPVAGGTSRRRAPGFGEAARARTSPFAVDANQGWGTGRRQLRAIRALEPYGVDFDRTAGSAAGTSRAWAEIGRARHPRPIMGRRIVLLAPGTR